MNMFYPPTGRCISNRQNPLDDTSAYVVGSNSVGGKVHAVRYTPGHGDVDLRALTSTGSSYALAVNDSGQVTGLSDVNSTQHACRYSDGSGMLDLGPGRTVFSQGLGINNVET